MERACRPLCGLQAGAASAEDEDRLLQGCESARRLPEPIVRLSRFHVSSEEDDMERAPRARLHACSQPEGVDVHQPDDPALDPSSSQRQIPCKIWLRPTTRTFKAGSTTTATSTGRSCVRP